jgi:hypothetical protein
MNRRDLIALVGSTAATWPIATGAAGKTVVEPQITSGSTNPYHRLAIIG